MTGRVVEAVRVVIWIHIRARIVLLFGPVGAIAGVAARGTLRTRLVVIVVWVSWDRPAQRLVVPCIRAVRICSSRVVVVIRERCWWIGWPLGAHHVRWVSLGLDGSILGAGVVASCGVVEMGGVVGGRPVLGHLLGIEVLLVCRTGVLVGSARLEVLVAGTLTHPRRVVHPVAGGPNRGRALVGEGCVVGVAMNTFLMRD